MWAILSSSPSELAGMIGFEKAEEGGGSVPSCGEGLISQTAGGVLGGASPTQRLSRRPRPFLHSETGR